MAPSHIDFAPDSIRRSLHRTRPLTWIAGILGLILWSGAGIVSSDLLDQHRSQEAHLELSQARLAARTTERSNIPRTRISENQASAVNHAIAQLNLPWAKIFDAIEAATPASVALLAIEPDAKKHSIKVTAETKTSDGMLDYLEQLKGQALFEAVVLTKHEVHDQDPNRPFRFHLEAIWTEKER